LSAEQPVSIERVSFYNELERRRKRGWISLAACVAAASGLGFVMSTTITPLMLLLCGGLLKLAVMLGVGGGPARAGIAAIHDFSSQVPLRFGALLGSPDQFQGVTGAFIFVAHLLTFLLPMAVPALLVGVSIWLGLRGLFLRASVVDLIQRYGARAARTEDLEERRLVNVVDEVAIGSGVPSPKLLVVDSLTVNATALGSTPEDAMLLVTRGLLDRLDRDETEAIMARLVTGLIAGDLHVAGGIIAAFHTLNFFLTMLSADPLVGLADARRLALLMVTPRPVAEAVALVRASLDSSIEPRKMPDFGRTLGRLPTVARMLLYPWFALFSLVGMLYGIVLFFWFAFFLNLPMRALWRNRCYWSDAQTIKLTRAPDAFARALRKVGTADPPGGAEDHTWLFIGAPVSKGRFFTDSLEAIRALPPATVARVDRLTAMGAGLPRTSAGNRSWKRMAANAVEFLVRLIVLAGFAIMLSCVFLLIEAVMIAGLVVGVTLLAVLI